MNHKPIGDRRRTLPRYTDHAIEHDPLETMLAQHQARLEAERAKVAEGRTDEADPADLRGIPCIARGVSGTSPGTNPLHAVIKNHSIRKVRYNRGAGDGTQP